MSVQQTAPYGTWNSNITSDLIASTSVRLGGVQLDGEDVYWLEGRPTEGGRYVLVRLREGVQTDVTPPGTNVRTRVHEYGGAAAKVDRGVAVFSNYSDQRLYRLASGGDPEPLTPPAQLRYADAAVDHIRERVICVREDHRAETLARNGEAVNEIVAVSLANGADQVVLASGSDFYASPRLRPGGDRMTWLAWDHPNMPWDGCELWVADLDAFGGCANPILVAGGPDESIFQPTWAPDGVLTFVSDRTGWWNLYRWEDGQVRPVAPMAAEFGLPLWSLGMATYAYATSTTIVGIASQGCVDVLATYDTETGQRTEIDCPYTSFSGLAVGGGTAYTVAASTGNPRAVVAISIASGTAEELRRSTDVVVDDATLSKPEPITFPSKDVDGAPREAHGFYYAPANSSYAGPPGEKPPLLVISHGGPTGATDSALSLSVQFWTSRGIAILDVNYGGSVGYGRAYRNQLRGAWGIIDVQDCVAGAQYLVARGDVDGRRLAIRGGSAGGYTTLRALTFTDVFHTGASYYGVSDLAALTRDTHKFESRYLERLVGPYPESEDVYRERSPIFHVENLDCPVIFLQGLEDRVVPPAQAETMVAALEQKGIPVAYLPFEGEQHGFRRAENMKRALDAELVFYGRVLGFRPAGEFDPVKIRNLDPPAVQPVG